MATIGYLFFIVLFSFYFYLCTANQKQGERKPLPMVSQKANEGVTCTTPKRVKCKDLRIMTSEELKAIASLIEANNVNSKAVLTTDEAAKYLGITKSAIYKMTMGRKIPHYRSKGGKLLYFQREEIEQWATSNKVMTEEELEAKANSLINKKGGRK